MVFAERERLAEQLDQLARACAASSGVWMSESSTMNSSPPCREMVSGAAHRERSQDATSRSSWSPTLWPSVSFTFLKRSRSMKSSRETVLLRSAAA